jgi:putative ABC transport system substrate-binding protein
MMDGFKAEMSAKGYTDVTYDVENAQGDSSTLNQIAAKLKTSDYDVLVPIATPAAQACTNAEIEIPMVFISVTDPVSAGLTTSLDAPDKGITGTSNFSPVDEIYTFGTTVDPAAADKTVGILYCTGEKNAVVTVQKMESYLDGIGKQYMEKTVTNSSECQQAASALAQSCGSIYVPMDSVVQSAMTQVTDTATQAGIPVFGSDPVMVKSGALVSVACGNETIGGYSADLAIQCIEGTDVAEIPVMTVTDNDKVVNKATAEALGLTIPDDSSIIVM